MNRIDELRRHRNADDLQSLLPPTHDYIQCIARAKAAGIGKRLTRQHLDSAACPWHSSADQHNAVDVVRWVVTDRDAIAQVVEEMAPKQGLIIADGHHRYETALNFRAEMREKHPGAPADAAFNYRMVTLVSMDDPGLTILPTHRQMHSYTARTTAQILADAADYFEVTPMAERAALEGALAAASPTDRRIGFYDGRYYLLRLKSPESMAQIAPDRAEEWRMLDVSILHELLIERVMGLSKEQIAAHENIDYHRDLDLALSQVDQGEALCVYIMNPTRMAEVRACSDQGAKMPQKSTDFYPKVITGLVAMTIGADERL